MKADELTAIFEREGSGYIVLQKSTPLHGNTLQPPKRLFLLQIDL